MGSVQNLKFLFLHWNVLFISALVCSTVVSGVSVPGISVIVDKFLYTIGIFGFPLINGLVFVHRHLMRKL